MDNEQSQPPVSPEAAGRLESWKEIAGYLKRDVRTLRRWEKNEGLPVHRHMHEKLPTVYAYKSELDAWWNNRRPRLEAQEAKETKEKSKRWLLAGALALAAVAAVTVGLGYWLAQPPPLAFEERDWVLIASFENRTGEPLFDGTLEYALERELSNSRFVNVVPRERIVDTLQLMRKPPDTRVDAALGREICLRDGGIRALLTGRVEKLDTTYVLSAALVNPADGVTVASFSEEAEGQKQVVPALRRLSSQVRHALGENLALIQESNQKLEKVTTPSLRALQLFSQGSLLKEQRQYKAAEEFLREAIAEDPEFTSAHLWLAYALMNQRRPKEEYLPHAERALELSESVTEHERYFIRASYYSFTGQYEKAVAPYEALLLIYPDHRFANGNLASIYQQLGRPQEAVPYYVRHAELRPNDFFTNARAAVGLVIWQNNPAEAKPYFQRALALTSPEIVDQYPVWAAWTQLFPAHEHWYKGEVQEALNEVTRVAETLKSPGTKKRTRWDYGLVVGFFYLDLGKLRAAEESFQHISDTAFRHSLLAYIALARGDMPAVREHMKHVATRKVFGSGDATLFARTGLFAEAERAIAYMEEKNRPEVAIAAVRGELALARGQTAQAIPLLQKGLEVAPNFFFGPSLTAAESLADIWERQGDLPRAIQVLETASQEKKRAFFGGDAYDWMRVQMGLAQLYRKVGREQDAQKIEAELRKLLAYADPDHALLRQLQATEEVAVTQNPE
ncbi:tetratricopeptide repeat protein [Acidobacteriia bacterium AH_259_A11_L15]|nr:tetratricopeptide repeat protein [Acidobacteriia bacterium AH_259_A11_L15]